MEQITTTTTRRLLNTSQLNNSNQLSEQHSAQLKMLFDESVNDDIEKVIYRSVGEQTRFGLLL